MKQEYGYAKGWRIFLGVLLPACMIGFGYLAVMPFINNSGTGAKIFLPLLAIGLEFLMVLGLIDLFKGKLIVEKDKITSVGVFKTRTLKLSEIKGFKKDDNYLYFVPADKKLKQIKVSTYVGGFRKLTYWTEEKFENLDFIEVLKDEQEILSNEDFGNTVEEREELLKKAKKVTRVINTISWISAISLWFLPYFYNIQVILCAALPIIGFAVYKHFKGIIRIDDKPNSAHPNLLSTFFIPSCVLMLRALMDFNVFEYENLWKPVTVIFASLAFLLIKDPNARYNFSKAATYFTILGMLLFGGMYAYGFIITSNSIFDPSQPEYYKAKILDKRISSGKHRTCYLKLSDWGPQKETEEVAVDHSLYNEKEVGDSALIYYNQGFYRIPYYLVVE